MPTDWRHPCLDVITVLRHRCRQRAGNGNLRDCHFNVSKRGLEYICSVARAVILSIVCCVRHWHRSDLPLPSSDTFSRIGEIGFHIFTKSPRKKPRRRRLQQHFVRTPRVHCSYRRWVLHREALNSDPKRLWTPSDPFPSAFESSVTRRLLVLCSSSLRSKHVGLHRHSTVLHFNCPFALLSPFGLFKNVDILALEKRVLSSPNFLPSRQTQTDFGAQSNK